MREVDGEPAVGTVLDGRYRLIEKIGAGGIGWVYRAEHLKLENHVAVKMLQTQFVGHDLMRPRFEREAKALAMLTHPHIVTLTDYSVADGRPYLVMEMLEGRALSALIDDGPMPMERARPIIRQILDALAYAHGKGFLHRDLKPDNVFIVGAPNDFVKLLDFGFVKLLDASGDDASSTILTRTGVVFGTPAYMSPEQISADRTNAATDVYSLGIMIFEMLAGQRPFRGENTDIVRQHLTAELPRLRHHNLEAGPELRAWLVRATAKRADQRFPSAIEMLQAFDALPETWMRVSDASTHANTLIEDAGGSASTRVSSPRRKKAASGTRWGLVGFAFLLIAALIAVARIMGDTDGEEVASAVTSETAPPTPSTQVRAPVAEPTPAAHVATPATTPTQASPAVAAATQRPTIDVTSALGPNPFTSREPVAFMTRAEQRVDRGLVLSDALERTLKEWAREHSGDPRPHLLLASHYINRRYVRDAIERFRLAYRVSPDARNDPRMLSQLLQLASDSDVAREAADTIVSVYGRIAKPVVHDELGKADLAAAVVTRLRALERRL